MKVIYGLKELEILVRNVFVWLAETFDAWRGPHVQETWTS